MTLVLHPRTEKMLGHVIDNLPQALIIEGPSGVGVTEIARHIARTVGSPELIILPKKKVKNVPVVDMEAGSTIIDDIRDLYLQTRTRETSKRVYIIDTGEKSMSLGAQNAFLKLLEEPRDNLHFIITTHHPDLVLPTIESRSQTLPVLPATDEQTARFIGQLNVTDDVKSKRLAFIGRGRPALIKRLVDDDEQYEARVAIMSDAKVILSGNPLDKLTVVQKYRDNRPDSLTLLEDVMHQLRTVMSSSHEQRLAREIEKYMSTYDAVSAGGNIRLQLTAGIL